MHFLIGYYECGGFHLCYTSNSAEDAERLAVGGLVIYELRVA